MTMTANYALPAAEDEQLSVWMRQNLLVRGQPGNCSDGGGDPQKTIGVAQRQISQTLREFGRQMNRHAGFTGVHPANAIHEGVTRCVLEEVTFRAGLNGAVDVFVAVERR